MSQMVGIPVFDCQLVGADRLAESLLRLAKTERGFGHEPIGLGDVLRAARFVKGLSGLLQIIECPLEGRPAQESTTDIAQRQRFLVNRPSLYLR